MEKVEMYGSGVEQYVSGLALTWGCRYVGWRRKLVGQQVVLLILT